MAFLNARTADTYKLRFSTQFMDASHSRSDPYRSAAAHLLVNDLFQATFISYATFKSFPAACRQRYRSGNDRRGTFGHRAQGSHTTVRCARTALVEFDFTRRFFSTRSMEPTITALAPAAIALAMSPENANTTICDNRNTGAFQRFNCVSNGSDLRNTYASNDTSRTDRPGPIPTLTALQPASAKARAPQLLPRCRR